MVTLVNRYRQRENIGRSECSYCHNGFKKRKSVQIPNKMKVALEKIILE